jgi:hypothetical protein
MLRTQLQDKLCFKQVFLHLRFQIPIEEECKNDADFGTRKLAREVFVARSIRFKIHFKLSINLYWW